MTEIFGPEDVQPGESFHGQIIGILCFLRRELDPHPVPISPARLDAQILSPQRLTPLNEGDLLGFSRRAFFHLTDNGKKNHLKW